MNIVKVSNTLKTQIKSLTNRSLSFNKSGVRFDIWFNYDKWLNQNIIAVFLGFNTTCNTNPSTSSVINVPEVDSYMQFKKNCLLNFYERYVHC